jgi:hypothetical protein
MTVFEQHTHEQLQRASQHICDLTLRDLFAMSSLNALLQKPIESFETVAKQAYRVADAMLKVREEK